MIHKMRLAREPFQLVKDGEKIIEMRLFDTKRKEIACGDTILFTNRETEENFLVLVTAINRFPDFKTVFEVYKPQTLGFRTKADWKEMYSFYTREDEVRYGVCAISIQRCRQIVVKK